MWVGQPKAAAWSLTGRVGVYSRTTLNGGIIVSSLGALGARADAFRLAAWKVICSVTTIHDHLDTDNDGLALKASVALKRHSVKLLKMCVVYVGIGMSWKVR